MKRIAIVGGGIAGLSAAFALDQARLKGTDVKYITSEEHRQQVVQRHPA